jgi:type I restriction enzyme S subunit
MTPDSPPKGWRRMSYGDALAESGERAGERTHLPVLSVTKTRGPMLASERFGKAMHGRDLARYRVAPRNHIVADPMLLWDGSIGAQKVVDAGLVSPDYRVYKPTDVADPVFMAFLVRSPIVQPYYQGGARGTNVRRNRIARSDFLSIPLSLPPLVEQRKIAAILSSVDDAIEATQALIEQLQVVKKAMMAELLTRGLPGRHLHIKRTEIGEVPQEWEVSPVGELVHPDTTITYGIVQAGPHVTSGIPYIRTGDVKPSGIVDIERLGRTSPEIAARFERSRVRAGDLVVCIRASVGAVALVPPTLDGANLTQGTARISPGPRVAGPFLLWALRSQGVQAWIDLQCKGSTFREITLGRLRQLPIPVPDSSEQDAIAGSLDAAEQRIRVEERARDGLRATKAALTSVLLTGEVRVTPDEAAA